jgi:hypothetical protein
MRVAAAVVVSGGRGGVPNPVKALLRNKLALEPPSAAS